MAVRDDMLARAWLVGVELTNWRTAAGLTQADIAAKLNVSRPLVSQFELGKTQPNAHHVTTALLECGASPAEASRLADFATLPSSRDWLKPWNTVIKPGMRLFLGAEGFASAEFVFATQVLPGLIQTPRYAAGMTNKSVRVRPDQEAAHVNLRMQRQRRVQDGDLRLTVVLEECILDRPAGPPDVMHEQFELLSELAAQDNVTILVLPTYVGRHEALDGRFVMLEFTNEQNERIAGPLVCVEMLKKAAIETTQDQLSAYDAVVRHTMAVALSQQDSITLFETHRDQLIG